MQVIMKTAISAEKLALYRVVGDVPFPMIGLSLLDYFKPEDDNGPLPLYYGDCLFLVVPVKGESTSVDVGEYVKAAADKAIDHDAILKDCLEYDRRPEDNYRSTIYINGGIATSAYLISDSSVKLSGLEMALLVNSLSSISSHDKHAYSISRLGIRIIGEFEDARITYTEDIKKLLNNLNDRAAFDKKNGLAGLPIRRLLEFLAEDKYASDEDTEKIKLLCLTTKEKFK